MRISSPSIVIIRIHVILRSDLGAGVLGDVEQPADQLQHPLLVHLADIGRLDDQLPRELNFGLGARIGLIVEEIGTLHLPFLIDQEARVRRP